MPGATDVRAYSAVGIPDTRIFVKLPEYLGELQTDLTAGKTLGFPTYGDLRTMFIDALP